MVLTTPTLFAESSIPTKRPPPPPTSTVSTPLKKKPFHLSSVGPSVDDALLPSTNDDILKDPAAFLKHITSPSYNRASLFIRDPSTGLPPLAGLILTSGSRLPLKVLRVAFALGDQLRSPHDNSRLPAATDAEGRTLLERAEEAGCGREVVEYLRGHVKASGEARPRRVSGEGVVAGLKTTIGASPLPPAPVARSVTPSPDGEMARVRGELERVRRERDGLREENRRLGMLVESA